MTHQIADLMTLFDRTFYHSFNTRLIKGDDEPVYLPANEHNSYHQIVFAHGYFSSALHEIAHWCLAGEARRQLEDFGYWYLPDGRDANQQAVFEQVEIKPQAIEWALSVAAKCIFNVSADNLNGQAEPDIQGFSAKVYQQVKYYLTHGFPPRAQQFIEVLAEFYQVQTPLNLTQFTEQPQRYDHQQLEQYYHEQIAV